MASEDVQTVERLYECFRTRDNETPFESYDEEIVWDATDGPVLDLQEVYRGHEGVRTFWRGWLAPWKEIDFEVEGIRDLGEGRVLAVITQRNLGRDSGIWVDMERHGHLWTLRDGNVVSLKYLKAEEAEAQSGLNA